MTDNKREEILRSAQNDNDKMNKIISLCKRRGFIYPASEIYGGFANAFDFGPLGSQLKKNFKDAWWQKFVTERDDMVGLDSAIIQNPKVWEASGHLKLLSDPLVECKKCHQRFRADHVKDAEHMKEIGKLVPEQKEMVVCPKGGAHEFTEAKNFNLMFKTFIGVNEDSASVAYLRPETAQGIFTNFQNVVQSTRVKLPFGIAQIGKAFRNEITPGNFIFRTREFEQLEIEYFISPDKEESQKWHDYWVDQSQDFYSELGIKKDNLFIRQHEADELSFYSIGTTDIEYKFPFGISELSGIAQRTDYDLKAHGLDYFEEDPSIDSGQAGKRLIPYVVEPSMGVDRALLAFLIDAYDESDGSDGRAEGEVTLRLSPKLAPFKVAVFPLMKKEGMPDVAHKIAAELKASGISTYYDESGSVGKRYRRQDEIGTPWCITVDFDSLTDKSVTVRDRDTMKQERVPIDKVVDHIRLKIK